MRKIITFSIALLALTTFANGRNDREVVLHQSDAAMAQTSRVKGDVNGDGSVTSVDVTVLYNYLLVGDTSSLQDGDVDSDGYITSGDVTFVYNILLGIEPVEDGHEYVDLGLPSGTLWATMNIDASSPEGYGHRFAWGETRAKTTCYWDNYKWCNGSENTLTKYCTMSSYGYNGFTDGKTELDPEDDVATAKWGPEWRLPSCDQFQELMDYCTSERTTINGVNGRLFTSNINGASLFLPATGYRTGELSYAGKWGYYWSRTLNSSYTYRAESFFFDEYIVTVGGGERRCGMGVRAVRVAQN